MKMKIQCGLAGLALLFLSCTLLQAGTFNGDIHLLQAAGTGNPYGNTVAPNNSGTGNPYGNTVAPNTSGTGNPYGNTVAPNTSGTGAGAR